MEDVVKNSQNSSQPTQSIKPKILLPKMNWVLSQKFIRELEVKRQTKVICFFISVNHMLNNNDVDPFFEILKTIGKSEKITLFLYGPGGSSYAALRIASLLRDYCEFLEILVPSLCASANTNLALSGDTIIMSSAGFLTPVDSSLINQLNPKGANNLPVPVSIEQIKRIVKFLEKEKSVQNEAGNNEGAYRTLFKYVHPLVVGEIDRVTSSSEMIAVKMMRMHAQSFENQEKIVEIAQKLVGSYPSHSFPILFDDAKELGLPVEKASVDLSELMWELVKVYDIASRYMTTNISENFYHYEEYPVIIETTGQRIIYRKTYNKRVNKTLHSVQVENNYSGWYRVIQGTSPKSPYKISGMDLPYWKMSTQSKDTQEDTI